VATSRNTYVTFKFAIYVTKGVTPKYKKTTVKMFQGMLPKQSPTFLSKINYPEEKKVAEIKTM
jgi:hypothetical protein